MKKQQRMFGKKGQVFMPLFIIVTLIIFGLLYADLAAKTEQFEKTGDTIGEKQLAVLNAINEGEKALLYLDIAARYAYGTAALETAKEHYLGYSSCEHYRGVHVVYGAIDCMSYHQELKERIEFAVTEHFNIALSKYLEAYENVASVSFVNENYLLVFKENDLLGIAQEALEIPIFSLTSTAFVEQTRQEIAAVKSSAAFIDQWPVLYEENVLNSCFGYRGGDIISGKSKGRTYHGGIDIRGPTGTPVVAVAAGTVVDASPLSWGMIVVDHGIGIYSLYLHLDTISVSVGDLVAKGQELGTTGGRGPRSSTDYNPHLHFEIIDTNIDEDLTDDKGNDAVLPSSWTSEAVNPLCYLSDGLEFRYKLGDAINPGKTVGCNTQGGPYKFCSLYKQQTGVSETTLAIKTTYTTTPSTQAMLAQIHTNYGTIIEDAIKGTTISKALVIGLIAQESKGNPDAVSGTGCQGLMQFCKETAYNYGLCDNKKCSEKDDRTVPEKAIPAGIKLLADKMESFTSYTDKEYFALAAYNGGVGVVKKAIEATGKKDPTWQEVSAALDQEIIAVVYSDAFSSTVYEENFGTTENRNKKVREIQDYAEKVLSYYHAYLALSLDEKETEVTT